MDTFRLFKMKNYVMHLIAGTLAILFGAGVLQSILTEIIKEFDPDSKMAYILGSMITAVIIVYGIKQIHAAFTFNQTVMKSLSPEESTSLITELEAEPVLEIPKQVVMTEHFLMVPVRRKSFVKIMTKDNILACFKTDAHEEKDATFVQLMFYDMNFKPTQTYIRGIGSSELAEEFHESICQALPWIYSEDFDGFLAKSHRTGYRKKLISEMKVKKERFESGAAPAIESEEDPEMEKTKPLLKLTSLKDRIFSDKSK